MGKMNVLGVMVAAIALCCSAADASIVKNGSFEDLGDSSFTGQKTGELLMNLGRGGNPKWDVFQDLPGGWTTTSGAGIEIQTDGTLGGVFDHTPGPGLGHYVELDSHPGSNSNSTMAQMIDLPSFGNYEVAYWFRSRTGDIDDDGIRVFLEDKNLVNKMIGETLSDNKSWVRQSIVLNDMEAGTYKLAFAAIGTENTLGGFIDDVSVHHMPEPATVAVWSVLCVVGMALIRRRRNR